MGALFVCYWVNDKLGTQMDLDGVTKLAGGHSKLLQMGLVDLLSLVFPYRSVVVFVVFSSSRAMVSLKDI